jgi:RelA/SpoT family (p)ppGpp synthetase
MNQAAIDVNGALASSNGVSINGASMNGVSINANGANGQSSFPSYHKDTSPTAPEVNTWTNVMSSNFLLDDDSNVEKIYQDLKDMSEYDIEQVDVYWNRLLPTVSYLGTENVVKICRALRVAYRAHRGQMRKSGDPYIIHPVEVALLLSGLKMDAETIMAGLLHDTVEDTALTFAQVEGIFGQVVRSIVEGETKVSKMPKLGFSDYADEQAENLRQMFVAMTDDYRIIIVKLADRLHNMRTLRHMKPEKQIKISRETLDIFAPLAHRMGIWQFKSELEDTAFMYLYPQEYKSLNRKLRLHQTKFRETLDQSQEIMRETLLSDATLRDQAVDVKVCGRTKEIYSLWHKMETKEEQNLDHIVDVVALRVIITPKETEQLVDGAETPADRGVWLCYHVLGLVQHLPGFQPVPTRVKDYISFPKPNGYQSLHTALMWNGQTIEVQIRTSAMHQVAEYGMASHWAYTDTKKRKVSNEELFNTPWLSSIKEWQHDFINSRDFVDSVRRELLGKRVFVFLRNGKILNLARGATAIDAAFQIHTEIGLNMHGVEINGKPVPFSYELNNGDVVSILTGGGKPATDWMRFAKIRSTRSKLRSYFRAKHKESLREAGKILVVDYLRMHGELILKSSYLYHEFTIPTSIAELSAFLPGNGRYDNMDELLTDVGKRHDRNFLHNAMAKIFHVPQSVLADAETNRNIGVPQHVAAAVNVIRQEAMDAADVIRATEEDAEPPPVEKVKGSTVTAKADTYAGTTRFSARGDSSVVEYADPEHVCLDCLPVHGDEIVGTRPLRGDSTTIVHRVGCSHAQRAINTAAAKARTPLDALNPMQHQIDSITLRLMKGNRFSKRAAPPKEELPVKLEWSEFTDAERIFFTCEVAVVAEDRKLLLADCSEIVSENCEIIKTGSLTSQEHATLVFLVRVHSLDHLQRLMDELGQVRAVMSVERRVSHVNLWKRIMFFGLKSLAHHFHLSPSSTVWKRTAVTEASFRLLTLRH